MAHPSEKRQRLLTLDLLRGLFLVVIFADHLAYAPSLFFQFATGTSGAFASAAEGFFAISGILVGYIYGPKILHATKKTAVRIWKRAALLYSLTVGFTLLYSAWATLLPHGYPRQPEWTGDVMGFLLSTLTLQFHFGWADFLARYAVFMAIAPLAVWLVAKGRGWIVGGASLVAWALWHTHPTLNIFTAWQIVFMFGIILGYYLPQLEKWASGIRPQLRSLAWWGIVGAASISYIGVVLRLSIIPFLFPSVSDTLPVSWLASLDKDSVGIARILIGILWFSGLYLLVRRFEQQIDRFTGGTLLLLGKNSLLVYSLEAFVIFAIDVFLPAPQSSPLIINTIIGIAGMTAIYAVIYWRAHLQSKNRIEV